MSIAVLGKNDSHLNSTYLWRGVMGYPETAANTHTLSPSQSISYPPKCTSLPCSKPMELEMREPHAETKAWHMLDSEGLWS